MDLISNSEFRNIETEKYTFKIKGKEAYMEYCIKEGAIVDVSDILEGKRQITEAYPGIKFYVMAEGINFFTLTPEARKLCATPEYSDNTIAIAFYTTNISLLLLGEMYNKINKPAVPTKIFNDRDEAQVWLKKQMQQNCGLRQHSE